MMRKLLTTTLVGTLALAGWATTANRHEAEAAGPLARLVLDVPVDGGSWRLHADGLVWSPDGVYRPQRPKLPRGSTLIDAAPTPSHTGFWGLTTKGSVVRSGDAPSLPRVGRSRVRGRVAAIAATPDGGGMYVVGANGTVSTYGAAPPLAGLTSAPSRIVDAAVTSSGAGLLLASAAGDVIALGDAAGLGGVTTKLVEPIVSITPTPSSRGYWLVSSDGGVFTFGDAVFRGSLGGVDTGQDVVGLQPDRDGYRLLGAFDRVDPFGNGAPAPVPIVRSVAPAPSGSGVSPSPVSGGSGGWFAGASWLYGAVPNGARLDPMNSSIVAALAEQGANKVVNVRSYGVPVYEADANTPRYQLELRHGGTGAGGWGFNDLMNGTVPIPVGAEPAIGTDAKIVVIDRPNNKVYDLWAVTRTGNGWSAAWGGVYPLDGDGTSHNSDYTNNGIAWPNPVSRGTGSGISSLSGIITADEIARGRIDHALVFATDITCGPAQTGPFRFPATTTDGSGSGNCIAEGARIQLDPSIDLGSIPGISSAELAVGRALQTYGAYVIDRGGSRIGFIAQVPTAWTGNPYPAAGFGGDYNGLPHIPWNSLRVLASWNGQ